MLVVPVGPWLADGIGWLSWHTAAQPFGSVQIVFAGQDRFGLFRLGAPSRFRTCAHGSGGRLLEGRARTLSGPSPDLSPVRAFASSPFPSGSRWSSSHGRLPMVLGRGVGQPEKRKVGGSIPPLTTTHGMILRALTSPNALLNSS